MSRTQIDSRINSLETHLQEENDVLHEVVQSFRDLDKIAYKLGILEPEQSYATSISWWPMISVLGTFSAGKSAFVNYHLGYDLQRTGNQAVDDKFTVICYGEVVNTLPGIALDADPRFPFYQISQNIAELTASSGQRVDAYLQVKTCPSEQLRGKILIDSPGFDADSQRTSTLRIIHHIIDLSDLVLVFFDARHPEPGAMRDTLEHLVANTIDRPDSNKFLYILNQMDITAREDNPEEVVAAWLRALAQAGLTAGRFYRIYNPQVCMPFPNPQVEERFKQKCQTDMKEIRDRMDQVTIERAYRVVGKLEQMANEIEHKIVPQLQELIQRWKARVFKTELFLMGLLLLGGAIGYATTHITVDLTHWQQPMMLGVAGVIALLAIIIHVKIGKMVANGMIKRLQREMSDDGLREQVICAFRRNTGWFRSLFIWFVNQPVGWCQTTRRQIYKILNRIDGYVQNLNNRFTNPSGRKSEQPEPIITAEVE
jgi:GTPase SAR1 family protein